MPKARVSRFRARGTPWFQPPLPTELPVAVFCPLFVWAPPWFVLLVPTNRLSQAIAYVSELGFPPKLFLDLGRVDRIPEVMPWSVIYEVIPIAFVPHQLKDYLEHLQVALLAVRADHVCLAQPSLFEDCNHGRVVIIDVYPVPYIAAGSVQLRLLAVQEI